LENIRKVIVRKQKEQKKKYKTLRLQAFDTGNWEKSQEIRKLEDKEWKKFKFLCDLREALDKKE
jgi:hypothetical protein